MSPSALRKRLPELALFLAFYFVFSLLYHFVLEYLASMRESYSWWEALSLREYWWNAGLQYTQYLFLSVLIWLLAVRIMRRLPFWTRLLTVAILIPVAIYFAREVRYDYLEEVGRWHLEYNNAIWDLYIPLLFLYFQFGCYFAYAAMRENQRKLIVEGELRQAALKSELTAIKAQLNPHFLYNVFNTINASLPPGSENAREMVSRLSDLFRYQLRASQTDLVPLREELSFVRNYLDLEHARFGDRLRVNINVAADLLDREVPPMLLQPLVENSIKHGLASLVEGGHINIAIFREGERLRFRIADTGVGVLDKNALYGKGIGLTNTRLRLEKRYGAALEILDNVPRGLIIQFTL